MVDEAGMLDQDTALALLTIADEAHTRVAFMGDRHQLPAVGRGGVLDLAHRWAHTDAIVSLDVVHRFADPEYSAITLAMRTGAMTYRSEAPGKPDRLKPVERCENFATSEPVGEELGERVGEVFGALWARDQIRIYATEAERTLALAELAAATHVAGRSEFLMVADTHEQTATLNGAVRDRLVAAGQVDDTRALTNTAGERLSVGDRVAARANDRDLGVANRDTWTVTAIGDDGCMTLRGRRPGEVRPVPASYAIRQVELAYATTVYGAQGETSSVGHLVLGEHTSAASAYVGMTRGRDDNVAHLVAINVDDARRQWEETLSRDRADLGPAVAARRAAEDVERYGPNRPRPPVYPGARHVRRVPKPTQVSHGMPAYVRPSDPNPGIGR